MLSCRLRIISCSETVFWWAKRHFSNFLQFDWLKNISLCETFLKTGLFHKWDKISIDKEPSYFVGERYSFAIASINSTFKKGHITKQSCQGTQVSNSLFMIFLCNWDWVGSMQKGLPWLQNCQQQKLFGSICKHMYALFMSPFWF